MHYDVNSLFCVFCLSKSSAMAVQLLLIILAAEGLVCEVLEMSLSVLPGQIPCELVPYFKLGKWIIFNITANKQLGLHMICTFTNSSVHIFTIPQNRFYCFLMVRHCAKLSTYILNNCHNHFASFVGGAHRSIIIRH